MKEVGLLESKNEKTGKNGVFVSLKVNGKAFNVFQPLVSKAQALRLNENVEITWEPGRDPKWPDVKDVCVQTGNAVSTPAPSADAPSGPSQYQGGLLKDVQITYTAASKNAVDLLVPVLAGHDLAWMENEDNMARVMHVLARLTNMGFTDLWGTAHTLADEMEGGRQ
jgi:hypothetical protein